MVAQRYRHRIAIEEVVETQNAATGAVTHTWRTVDLDSDHDLSAVPAAVLTGPGREGLSADTKAAETSARIQFRWFPGLRADMRVVWDGRYYDIQSIEMDATGRREYRLRCREGLTDGG